MHSLVAYSGSDSDSEPEIKRTKLSTSSAENSKTCLPKASDLLGVKKEPIEEELDDPDKHEGRIRSFKHERGNWATHIHIPVDPDLVEDVQESLQIVCEDFARLHTIEYPHLSLSRTVVLQYHQIDVFARTLEDSIQTVPTFCVSFRQLRVYTNDERTRTFIAFQIDAVYTEKLLHLLKKVDDTMQEFRLAPFYEDPSFHVSILWCLGDQVELLTSNMERMKSAIALCLGDENDSFSLNITSVQCKSGNKEFQFQLLR